MNKELEEAKQKLKEFVGLFYEFPNPTSISIRDYEVEAIETVLNYIENSIPKKKVEEKIEKIKLNKNHKYTAGTVVAIMNELQELLEVE